jgi:hypothetical protein
VVARWFFVPQNMESIKVNNFGDVHNTRTVEQLERLLNDVLCSSG